MNALASLVRGFSGRPIAVIGDLMLDHFLVGHVERISPEAPVPVVRYTREEFRLGGAGNVAQNITVLGGVPSIVSLVGADAAREQLSGCLRLAGLDDEGLVVDRERPTTRKVRIVTVRNQQVARVDYEADADARGDALSQLCARASDAARRAQAIVLSDYRKGVVTPEIIEAVVSIGRARGVPVLVDPKLAQADRYRGTSLITPNHHEAELMTQMTIRSSEDARRAARLLHERTGADDPITWGEHGMWVFDRGQGSAVETALPAEAREVADVTGAGDTVIAVLALAIAAGARLVDAARLANAAAGLVVARFGPSSVTPEELAAAVGG